MWKNNKHNAYLSDICRLYSTDMDMNMDLRAMFIVIIFTFTFLKARYLRDY
jgi:hypothetical protein